MALTDRLLAPTIDGTRRELGRGARSDRRRTFAQTIAEHGPDAIAFYVSGQFLTEDYYVANKLMKGFIGSANIDTNSRLCMASSVAGHVRAFGEDIVPGCYEDLEEADLVVLVGSNMAWCHPVLYQRLMAARETRAARRSSSSIRAAPRPATPPICIWRWRPAPMCCCSTGCWRISPDQSACDRDWIARHVAGFDEALAAARQAAPSLDDRRRRPRRWRREDLRRLLRLVRPHRAGGDALFAGREPVRQSAPTRSTPSSTAISPPGASAGPAWGRSR